MFEKAVPYHIMSHAVEGKRIFINEEDSFRFVFQSYAANIGRPAFNLQRKDIKEAAYAILNGQEIPENFITIEHSPLTYSLSFAYVGNHHHDILISNTDNGISKYLQKLHTGFAKYFNLKYGHRTALFARKFKVVPVRTEAQLYAVVKYVNIKNPLDIYEPNWVSNGLRNREEAINFLNNYQFSSLSDLTGKRNSKLLAPQAILEQFLMREIVGRDDCDKFVDDYLEEKLASFKSFFLE